MIHHLLSSNAQYTRTASNGQHGENANQRQTNGKSKYGHEGHGGQPDNCHYYGADVFHRQFPFTLANLARR